MLRLKTSIFITAWQRRCMAGGAFATVARKGDPDGGLVIVKSMAPDRTATAVIETYHEDPRQRWRPLNEAPLGEDEIDRLIERETRFDTDLWVVEVEDRDRRLFLGEPDD